MNAKQEAKLSMYDAVIAHCNANSSVIAAIPAFTTAFGLFKTKVDAIKAAMQAEATIITGVSIDKAQLKQTLIRKALAIAAAVYAYATVTNNFKLKEQVNYCYSDLNRSRDEMLTPATLIIYNAANANSAALADYGITAATLNLFDTAINNYREKLAAPRNAVSLRSAYGTSIVTTFRQADKILKDQVDKIAVQFLTTNQHFYNAYKNNRIIIDAPTSKAKAIATSEISSPSLSNGAEIQDFSQS